MNEIISAYKAVINNQVTALSGCDNKQCQFNCLRKDKRLVCRDDQNIKNDKSCNFYISVHQL